MDKSQITTSFTRPDTGTSSSVFFVLIEGFPISSRSKLIINKIYNVIILITIDCFPLHNIDLFTYVTLLISVARCD